jgi:hypothetical protein
MSDDTRKDAGGASSKRGEYSLELLELIGGKEL